MGPRWASRPRNQTGFRRAVSFFFNRAPLCPTKHWLLSLCLVNCGMEPLKDRLDSPLLCCARCAKRDGTRPWLRDDRTLSPAHSPRFVVVSGTRKKSSLTSRSAPRSPLHQRVRQNYTMPTTATAAVLAVRRPYPHHTERRRRAEMPVGTLGRNRLPKILLVQQPQARHLQRTRGIEAQ